MRTTQPLLFILTVPALVFAQSSPTPTATAAPASATPESGSILPVTPPAPDGVELTKLLTDFLAGASRNDAATHDRFWAQDLIYTGSSGRRIGKADIMREVHKEKAASPAAERTIYSAEDIRIQQYGTTAIVAFRLVGTTRKGDKTEIANYLNSGTFLKRDGKWQAVSWQATKMPAAEPVK